VLPAELVVDDVVGGTVDEVVAGAVEEVVVGELEVVLGCDDEAVVVPVADWVGVELVTVVDEDEPLESAR